MTDYNGCSISATTNKHGVASFCINSCTPYQICETTAPCGYQINCTPINVFIDCYGRVYLNGCCTYNCYVVVPNFPNIQGFHLCFLKVAVTGDE